MAKINPLSPMVSKKKNESTPLPGAGTLALTRV